MDDLNQPSPAAVARLCRMAERLRARAQSARDPRDVAELLSLATECDAIAQEMAARLKAGP